MDQLNNSPALSELAISDFQAEIAMALHHNRYTTVQFEGNARDLADGLAAAAQAAPCDCCLPSVHSPGVEARVTSTPDGYRVLIQVGERRFVTTRRAIAIQPHGGRKP